MGSGPWRAAGGREGTPACRRRACRQAPPPADGRDRQGLCLRGPEGNASLLDLFEGRPQLIVYHFMFGPNADVGATAARCSSTTSGTSLICGRETPRSPLSPAPRCQARGVQAAHGLGRPLVLLVRRATSTSTSASHPLSPSPAATRTVKLSASASSFAMASGSSALTSPTGAASSRSPAIGRCST